MIDGPMPARAVVDDLVRRALAEDVGSGDVTTAATIPPGALGRGVLLAKAPMVVAGLDVARAVFAAVAGAAPLVFTPKVADGDRVVPGDGPCQCGGAGGGAADRRTHGAQPAPAALRHCHRHARLC